MRKPYHGDSDIFDAGQLVAKEPIANFAAWYGQACETPSILKPNAMSLATATKYVSHDTVVFQLVLHSLKANNVTYIYLVKMIIACSIFYKY